VDLVDRAEDIDIGTSFTLKGGYAPKLLGSSADEGYARLRVESGHDAGRWGFGQMHAGVQSRFRRDPQELQGDLTARWVQQPRDRWTLVAATTGVAGRKMPSDWQLTLGGLTGLRAFPVHELTGNQVWRANAEVRWIGVRDLLRLVSVGAAGFWDSGRAWGPGSAGAGWHQDVGFGLRLSLPHSALNAVARFDVAWPISPSGDGRHGAAYSFGSGQAF
jgi:hemolysin activation/secretion protein